MVINIVEDYIESYAVDEIMISVFDAFDLPPLLVDELRYTDL